MLCRSHWQISRWSVVTFWDIGEAFMVDIYQTLRDKYLALAAHPALLCADLRVKTYRDKHRSLTLDLSTA